MRTARLLPIVFVLVLSAFACTLSPMVDPPPTQTPTVTIPAPTRTPPPPTPTVYLTLTPIPATPVPPTPTLPPPAFTAEVLGKRVNLRSGPSILHSITGMVPKGVYVSIIGKTPGDEWVFVRTSEEKTGWLSVKYLLLHGSLSRLPELPVESSELIEGEIIDGNGNGINGVNLAVYQGEGAEMLRVEAASDATGKFYAYLPAGANGKWTVEVVGVSCRSWIMDPDCQYHGAFRSNGNESIQPPLSQPLYFVFDNRSQQAPPRK